MWTINGNTMNDPVSLQRIQAIHPAVVQDFINFITDAETGLGIVIRVTQGLRTFAEQAAIYAQGRTTPGKIVSNAKPGQSYHQYGLAADLSDLVGNGTQLDWNYDMALLVPYAAKYEITWGGNFPGSFKDYPHFEKTLGFTWEQLLVKYNAQDFISGTTFVQIP